MSLPSHLCPFSFFLRQFRRIQRNERVHADYWQTRSCPRPIQNWIFFIPIECEFIVMYRLRIDQTDGLNVIFSNIWYSWKNLNDSCEMHSFDLAARMSDSNMTQPSNVLMLCFWCCPHTHSSHHFQRYSICFSAMESFYCIGWIDCILRDDWWMARLDWLYSSAVMTTLTWCGWGFDWVNMKAIKYHIRSIPTYITLLWVVII